MTRAALSTMAAVAAALAFAASAAAYWSAAGGGAGAAATGSLGRVDGVDTSVHATVATTTFDVAWSAAAVPASVAPVYVVERHAGSADTVVCTTTSTRCTLTGVPDGKATYSVTPLVNSWSGAESAPTASVKVSSAAPTITAAPASGTAETTASLTFTHPAFHAFRCRLDGGPLLPCPDPAVFTALTPGAHTFQVQAVDGDGALTAAATWAWTITG